MRDAYQPPSTVKSTTARPNLARAAFEPASAPSGRRFLAKQRQSTGAVTPRATPHPGRSRLCPYDASESVQHRLGAAKATPLRSCVALRVARVLRSGAKRTCGAGTLAA